ncbi:hypothetical protein GCM10010156_29980 [Planobispora rosea]|uniref:Uncharacterized protein n=2 Tax=Planobispora rosea TaxID=35762 RepID=A0A8J3WAN7_PLARO|nr:hypothetical protein [Planobispora rosea]GGS69029.1 hypothetical protein GCM10010156_29980 [Planobispora rosea]GIH82083.1 hypothetical protein Pro02_04910 [Planobispora rosea]
MLPGHSARTVRPIARRSSGPRRARRRLQPPHARAGEDCVECAGERGTSVTNEEAEGTDLVTEVHEQVAGLLNRPRSGQVGGHTEDVHAPGGDFHDEQHMQALQEHRVDVEEIDGQQPMRLGA